MTSPDNLRALRAALPAEDRIWTLPSAEARVSALRDDLAARDALLDAALELIDAPRKEPTTTSVLAAGLREDLLSDVRLRHGEAACALFIDGLWYVGWLEFRSGTGTLCPVLVGPGQESEAAALFDSLCRPRAPEPLPPSGARWT